MKPLLCISLLLLCTSSIAEIDDMPEGATLEDDVVIASTPVSESHKDCKIICQNASADEVRIEYISGNVPVVHGCGQKFAIECEGERNGR